MARTDHRSPDAGVGWASPARQIGPGQGSHGDGADLRSLFGRLGRDASQLAHDELELAKLELRDIATSFSADIKEAGRTMVKDLVKFSVALTLALLAGLAITAGLTLVLGELLGDAYWAGALITGGILLIAAAIFGASAARDLRSSDELRLEGGRRALDRDGDQLREQMRETSDFVRREAREFKRHASTKH